MYACHAFAYSGESLTEVKTLAKMDADVTDEIKPFDQLQGAQTWML